MNIDSYHGDEIECRGRCGLCSDCNDAYYRIEDEDYENYRSEAME